MNRLDGYNQTQGVFDEIPPAAPLLTGVAIYRMATPGRRGGNRGFARIILHRRQKENFHC